MAWAQPQSGRVPVPDGEIYFEAEGAGPPLVLLHDGLAGLRVWDELVPELAASFRVVRYDRRGYGSSPVPTVPFVPRDDLRLLLDHLRVPRAILVGSSAGADLALRVAIAYPSRVEKLVLLGPVVSGLGFSDHFQQRNGRIAALGQKEGGTAATIEAWLVDPYLLAPASAAARERLGEILRRNPQVLTKPQGLERGRRAFGHLGELKMPVLVVVGESDHPDIHAHAGAIQAQVAGAQRQVLAESGHLLALEQPKALAERMLPFLLEQIQKERPEKAPRKAPKKAP
jgi:pimeloyl-ACP methyl ester carboxylesterase